MAKIKHDIWQDPEGLTSLCFSGVMGMECRRLLEPNSKIIHSFYADSHYEAMIKYYEFMGWGKYETEFETDKLPYNSNKLIDRNKVWIEIDKILWKDWDPIGVNDFAPTDEYQSYVSQIFHLLINGASIEEIADRLYRIETKVIGVGGNKENCRSAAKKIKSIMAPNQTDK